MKSKKKRTIPTQVSWLWERLTARSQELASKPAVMTILPASTYARSWQRFYDITCGLVSFLHRQGIAPGDVVAIDAPMRCESLILWSACQYLGAAVQFLPIDMRSADMHSECLALDVRLVLADDPNRVKSWLSWQQADTSQRIILYADVKTSDGEMMDQVVGWPIPEGICSFEAAVERFGSDPARSPCQNYSDDTVLAYIYSQGTHSGERRIALTNASLRLHSDEICERLELAEGTRVMIGMDSSHAIHLKLFAACLARGASLILLNHPPGILESIRQAKPNIVFLLPHALAQLTDELIQSPEQSAFKARWHRFCVQAGKFRNRNKQPYLKWSSPIIKGLCLSPIKRQLGTDIKAFVSFGAPFDSHVAEFFSYLDIPTLNAYTVADVGGIAHLHTFKNEGGFLRCIEPRIKGGVLSVKIRRKGASLISTDDYVIEDARCGLCVRRNQSFTLAGGKTVDSTAIRDAILREPLIEELLIFGQDAPFLTALVYLAATDLQRWASSQKIPNADDFLRMSQHQKIYAHIKAHIDACNLTRATGEAIRKFAILPRPIKADARVLSPCGLVRRFEAESKYAPILRSFYHEDF
ncbi:MAG: AMP-binding protein [Proteobacteria bacterium]|nr:AMP-binding protein [Pseudomonadota bacterium]